MALDVKKRQEKALKADQMIEESLKNNIPMPKTASDVILEGLNNELTKEIETTNKTAIKTEESKIIKTSKAGRKRVYDNDRFLIHVRVDEMLKDKIDSAVFARKQTMQDYIMDLIMEDMNKNGDKYKTVYESMLEFQRNFN
ncbi:MAG: hypothetical protein K6F69_09215 [Treponema sp.]|nr:hypothetical protein [Treponema sp.]